MSKEKGKEFVDLLVTSLLGTFSSVLLYAVIAIPINIWARASLWGALVLGVAVLLYAGAHWTDPILRYLKKRKVDLHMLK
jgi:hypothetical protein